MPDKIWISLLVIRTLWALCIQKGYIHPDEFFQSQEIVAGDILGLETYRPWEFNSTFPIRSIIPVYLMSAPPLLLFKWFSNVSNVYNSGYLLFAFSRLWTVLLSFTIDWNLFRTFSETSKNLKHARSLVIILSSSCIMLVFAVRSFSNSLELILFAWLIRLTISENTDFQKNILSLSIVTVTGFFTRPTFLIFAFVPLLYYFAKSSNYRFMDFLKICINYSLTCLSVSFFYILIDSIYFQSLHFEHVLDIFDKLNAETVFKLLENNLTVTPYNFIKYNLNTDNLAQHGLHHRSTHLLVNSPLLFSTLFLSAIFILIKSCAYNKFDIFNHLNKEKSLIIIISWLFPLFVLSIFPHQEPRFLMPLLIPLVIVFAPTVFRSKFMFTVWIVQNLFTAIFFGAVHQAGMVPAILSARSHLISSVDSNVSIVFWKSYMPPRSLFNVHECASKRVSNKIDNGDSELHCELQHLSIHDMAGASEIEVIQVLDKLFNVTQGSTCSNSLITTVFLFVPGSIVRGSSCAIEHFRFQLLDSFWPHFSGEHPPFSNHPSLTCSENNAVDLESCISIGNGLSNYMPRSLLDFLDSSSYKIFNVSIADKI